MPLKHLLYRCPRCGHDPTRGEGDEVECPGCGARFRRSGAGARIEVVEAGGAVREVPAWEVAGGPVPRSGALASSGGSGSAHEAEAVVYRMLSEEPVWFQGRLSGFCERLSDGEAGVLRLEDGRICFRCEDGREEAWPVLDVKAVQTSSKSIQVILPDDELRQFRFADDSPLRWEDLLRGVIRKAWREAGRGEITEFQPRITGR